MRPDEDTNNSVSNTAASEDVGAVSSSDMGGMGVSIGGTGGGYDPNYGSVGPASSLATDLGMGAYGTSAMSDFSRGESDRNYFSPTPIDDYSLTRGQTKYGYSIGTYGPNYGLTQLPESYTTDRGSRRVREDEARTYANFLNVDINAIPGYSREPTTIAGKIGAFIGGNLGSPVGRDFVVNPQTGFIGQVVDERSGLDLIGNVLTSLINPLPISPNIETAKVKDIRNIREKEKELQMYTGPLFSGTAGKTVPLSEYEKQMAENRKPSTGDEGTTAYAPTTLSNKSVVARALSGINVNVASMIQQSSTPSIEPASYAPAYQENTFASSYMAPMSYGGVAESNIAQEMQMGGLATKMTMDIPDVMNLAGQAEQIKTNPEQFFIDPNEAMTAADLKGVYDYNKKITSIANGRMQLPTPMQAGGEAVNGPVGFVDSTPEQVAPTDTVADDVPMDVEEGTFILNAASVEFAGSDDIKRMLLNAMKEAERQGIDISTDDNKISREETVSLLVSRGEVVVPTALAKIIGYDRLEKINNRGKKEVARREQEAQQQQPQEPQEPAQPTNPAEGMAMQKGGVTYVQGQGSVDDSGARANISGEYRDESFAVRPSVDYSEQSDTTKYPDGVVVDTSGKNLGFAIDGEMFLTDDSSLRAGIQRQSSTGRQAVQIPAEMGGETFEFSGGQKMKRYNMGATFGDISADISKTQGSGQPISGRVQYRFSPNGEVFIEGTDDGRSGRIGLNYSF